MKNKLTGNTQFVLDKTTPKLKTRKNTKYMIKTYSKKGKIIFFEEENIEDGFNGIISQLTEYNKAELFVPVHNLKAILEFLDELKHSVQNAQLTLKFYQQNSWHKVTFQF